MGAFLINAQIRGKDIDINSVHRIMVNNNGSIRTYFGSSAINYLNSVGEKVRVKKGYYRYYEIYKQSNVARKDLAQRVTNSYENRTNSVITQKLKLNATQSWLINNLDHRYREVVIKALGVEWANTYSIAISVTEQLPVAKRTFIEFYPLMEYSHGYIERWYDCANDSNIKICLERIEIETYSPSYTDEQGNRELNGVFYAVYEDFKK